MLLNIENLTVEFTTASGMFRAVDQVSLQIDDGEVLAVVGHKRKFDVYFLVVGVAL